MKGVFVSILVVVTLCGCSPQRIPTGEKLVGNTSYIEYEVGGETWYRQVPTIVAGGGVVINRTNGRILWTPPSGWVTEVSQLDDDTLIAEYKPAVHLFGSYLLLPFVEKATLTLNEENEVIR